MKELKIESCKKCIFKQYDENRYCTLINLLCEECVDESISDEIFDNNRRHNNCPLETESILISNKDIEKIETIKVPNCFRCPFYHYLGGLEGCILDYSLTSDNVCGRDIPKECPLRKKERYVRIENE